MLPKQNLNKCIFKINKTNELKGSYVQYLDLTSIQNILHGRDICR